MTDKLSLPESRLLTTNQDRFLHALQMVKLGYWHWDLSTQAISWSAETYHFFGMDPKQDQPDMEVFMSSIHPDDRDKVDKNNQGVMTTGHAPDMEFRVIKPGGELIHLYTRAEMIYDEENKPAVLFGTLQDITKQKQQMLALEQTQSRLESALQAKNEFLSMMSHELNTPMNAIQGFAQLLQFDLKGELLEYSTEIFHAAQHLSRTFSDILKYVELDKSLPEQSEIDLIEFLSQFTGVKQAATDGKSVTISLTNPEGDFSGFHCDRKMLTEILAQLLSNATNYSFPGGVITVTPTALDNGRIKIIVADTGKGIPTHRRESIFIPFERAGKDQNIDDLRGTGIGLTIARKLSRMLGGDLQLLADTGKGSSFELNLPKLND